MIIHPINRLIAPDGYLSPRPSHSSRQNRSGRPAYQRPSRVYRPHPPLASGAIRARRPAATTLSLPGRSAAVTAVSSRLTTAGPRLAQTTARPPQAERSGERWERRDCWEREKRTAVNEPDHNGRHRCPWHPAGAGCSTRAEVS